LNTTSEERVPLVRPVISGKKKRRQVRNPKTQRRIHYKVLFPSFALLRIGGEVSWWEKKQDLYWCVEERRNTLSRM